MTPIDAHVFSEAVRIFWRTRDQQAAEQRLRGISDKGTRGAVTGGKQKSGFVETIARVLISNGVEADGIHFKQAFTDLPGYFRPSKKWDIVVIRNRQLLAAIELKSHVGSFGNNFNNRTEEAMGSALDFWTAFREGAFGQANSPWLGYLLVLQASPRSIAPVRVHEPHFGVFPEFRDASYATRYE